MLYVKHVLYSGHWNGIRRSTKVKGLRGLKMKGGDRGYTTTRDV